LTSDRVPSSDELEAAERALRALDGIADAVVVLRADGSGAQHVVAFYVAADGMARDHDALRAGIRARVPGAALPEHFGAVERFARNASGEIDRAALRLSARAERLLRNAEPIPPHDGPAPLTVNQELIWLLDRTSPADPAYNVSAMLRLTGPLDRAALQRAIDAIVERQAVLRTTISGEAASARQIVHPAGAVPIESVDVQDVVPEQRLDAVERITTERLARGFDLEHEPPFRFTVIALGPDDHMLLWTTHHIFMDDTSMSMFWREILPVYDAFVRGAANPLPPLPITFGDFAAWQRASSTEERLAPQIAYWRERLRGAPERLALPVEPALHSEGFIGGQVTRFVSDDLIARLTKLGETRGTTLYVVLMAAFAALLSRYTEQDDVIVGSGISGRTHRQIENLFGYFVNTLPQRHDVSGDPTLDELIARVAASAGDVLRNQDVPLEMITSSLQRDGGAPQIQCVLTMRVNPTLPADAGGAVPERIWVDSLTAGFSKFDLVVLATKEPGRLRLTFQYRIDVFTASTVAGLAKHFTALLDAIASDPSARVSSLRMLSEDEEDALRSAHGPAVAFDDGAETVLDRFAASVARAPGATAVRCGDETVTYADLDVRSSALATSLREAGAARGSCVGICVDRSIGMVAAMLAVMKSGAAYVPLPPDQPRERLAVQIAGAGVTVAVADAASRASLPDGVTVVAADAAAAESAAHAGTRSRPARDDVAYVLFTSGSTGVPKGVAVTHGNLLHYTRAISQRLGLRDGDALSFATVSTLGADLGYTAIFPALCSGGVLHVVPNAVATDAARFAAYAASHPIDVLKITPSHFAALLRDEDAGRAVPRRCLVFGGEALSWSLVERVRATSACRVLNHYGPTETTVGACSFVVGDEDLGDARPVTVPIGTPLPNVRCYVVDARGALQPDGIAGELWIGGPGVARGYVGEPRLTAGRFADDAFAGEPGAGLYKTGDRVRRLASGHLEFLGRLDDQVKVRGFRVELGDVEAALRAHASIAQAAVVCDRRDDAARLVAYAVARADGAVDTAALRAWLGARLPDYMVPAAIVLLDRLPLTANGKIDRAALPDPDEAAAGERAFVEPRTPTEARICAIWSDVMKLPRVGATDDFLELGGHSIVAIRVLGKISAQLGVRLPLKALFDTGTPECLAAHVDAELRGREEREIERVMQTLAGLSDEDVDRLDVRAEIGRS